VKHHDDEYDDEEANARSSHNYKQEDRHERYGKRYRRSRPMSVITKVSELSIEDLKTLIRETMLETLQEFSLQEIDDDEQAELEAMFGTSPLAEEAVYERQIDL